MTRKQVEEEYKKLMEEIEKQLENSERVNKNE